MRWTRRCRVRMRSQGEETRERSREARETSGSVADGQSVWSWHPLLVSSRRRYVGPTGRRYAINSPATVARRIRRRGELAIHRKTIAWGMPDVFRCLRCEYSRADLLPPAHARLRVHWAPGIPRALLISRDTMTASTRGDWRLRDYAGCRSGARPCFSQIALPLI
jgi:hypothetical protein